MKKLAGALTAAAVGIGLTAGTGEAMPSGVGAATTASSKRAAKKVTVSNDFYTPILVKVAKGGNVKWIWQNASDGHNVTLHKAPRGVKKSQFRSPTQTSGTFTRKLAKPGTYKFHCTIHPLLMNMTVKVSR